MGETNENLRPSCKGAVLRDGSIMLDMTELYYFSPTGGTKKAGKSFCKGIAESVKEIDLGIRKESIEQPSCTGADAGDSYLTEDEIADRALQYFVDNFRLKADLEEQHKLIQGFWVNAPIFPDVRNFFERCPLPIYIISNNGMQYVNQAMKLNNLLPAGIVCADMIRAYKPHRELFEKALEISGCNSDEVLHVGDSYQSDALGALSAGIKPILQEDFMILYRPLSSKLHTKHKKVWYDISSTEVSHAKYFNCGR